MSNKPTQRELVSTVIRSPVHLLAFGFGSGLAPFAPGTFGTLAAVLLYLPMQYLSLPLYCLMVAAVCVAGVWICGRSSEMLGVHDHGGIVWDEFAGYFITMIAAPAGWQWIVLGFVLFRIFDIIKPWPIKWADKQVHGGLGIMLDDILAGFISLALLQVIASLGIL
ncbi:phosphatidylglycerophosphatase A family protein [Leucothrix pacifica]|uniref:Phosphatidylglycerophosphatase A n=1 Tax=Leucothrix pacifica TaxID=1247513 RepID=A0A317CUY2_9GAMM|nr:phosphatidylglycerophosphatase A [Leucothrix pacifica]PWR00301.1 phosphatidylglycerophosphatase A [Leucothrix pacifica]